MKRAKRPLFKNLFKNFIWRITLKIINLSPWNCFIKRVSFFFEKIYTLDTPINYEFRKWNQELHSKLDKVKNPFYPLCLSSYLSTILFFYSSLKHPTTKNGYIFLNLLPQFPPNPQTINNQTTPSALQSSCQHFSLTPISPFSQICCFFSSQDKKTLCCCWRNCCGH